MGCAGSLIIGVPLGPRYHRLWHRHHRGALWAAIADHEPVQQTLRPGHHHPEHRLLLRGHQHPGPAQHQHHGKRGWQCCRAGVLLTFQWGGSRMLSSGGCGGARILLAVSSVPDSWRAVSSSPITYPLASSSCSLATPVLPIIFTQIMSFHD